MLYGIDLPCSKLDLDMTVGQLGIDDPPLTAVILGLGCAGPALRARGLAVTWPEVLQSSSDRQEILTHIGEL